jgi:glycine betaine/proline transport system permease protein/glycine betaine/proline transport system substrate-binding protein
MNAAIVGAYERGNAIVAYYWEPTWLLGMHDMVLLEDRPFTNHEDFQAGKTECPPNTVTICASNGFVERNPEFTDMLRNYRTSSAMISQALAFMQETNATHEEAAVWFLQNNDDWLSQLLPADKAQLVRDGLS